MTRADEMDRRIALARGRSERWRATDSGSDDELLQRVLEELERALDDHSITTDALRATDEELRVTAHELSLARAEAVWSSRRYRDLFHGAPDPYVVTDEMGVIRELNETAERRLGRFRRFLVGKPLLNLVDPKDANRFVGWLRSLRKREVRISGEPLQLIGPDGGFDVSVIAALERREEGVEILWLLRDVSRQKQLESQLRAASTAAVVAEEGERRRLADDLHDEVGQLLTLAGMKLGALRSSPGRDEDAVLGQLAELIRQAQQRIESLSFQLSAPVLQDLGLSAAAEWLAEEMNRSYDLQVRVRGRIATRLPEELNIVLFRGLRELLVNVARHAKADAARCSSRRRAAG